MRLFYRGSASHRIDFFWSLLPDYEVSPGLIGCSETLFWEMKVRITASRGTVERMDYIKLFLSLKRLLL